PQERLEAGIWQAYIDRPFDPDFQNLAVIYRRIPEDDIREEFFKNDILKAATETRAKRVLVMCGAMHAGPVTTEKLSDSNASQQINNCKKELAQTSTIDSIRELESIAAKIYWQAWRNTPINFLGSDLLRVPDHWKSFGT